MNKDELKAFYEDHNISIRKYLNDYFETTFEIKLNNKGKKWRISHSEIDFLPLVVPISALFSMRYIELVEKGLILVVKDEFGKNQTYINPKYLMETLKEDEYIEELKKQEKPFYEIDEILMRYATKKYYLKKLSEIEETKRIVRHFKKESTLEYLNSLKEGVDDELSYKEERKRINKVELYPY